MYDAPDLVTYMFHRVVSERQRRQRSLDEKRLHYLRKLFSYNNRFFCKKKFLSTTKKLSLSSVNQSVIFFRLA